MFGKNYAIAFAVATAATIGLGSTAASAAILGGGGGGNGNGNGSLINISNNQVPVQLCNDTVAVNVLGVQVPASGLSGALSLLSSGDTKAAENSSCAQAAIQRVKPRVKHTPPPTTPPPVPSTTPPPVPSTTPPVPTPSMSTPAVPTAPTPVTSAPVPVGPAAAGGGPSGGNALPWAVGGGATALASAVGGLLAVRRWRRAQAA